MISGIEVAMPGWKVEKRCDRIVQYANPRGDVFSGNFFDRPPDIPAPLANQGALRSSYRQMLIDAGLGLLELEVRDFCGLPSVYLLAKAPLKPHGFLFPASVTIPRRSLSYVLKFQAIEAGTTGMREAMVMATMELDIDEATGQVLGWTRDPYDESLEYPIMRNLSDAPEYDAEFPDHPLSRTRAFVDTLEANTNVAQQLRDAPPFA